MVFLTDKINSMSEDDIKELILNMKKSFDYIQSEEMDS